MGSARSPRKSPAAVDLQALVHEPVALIGRDAELERVTDILAQRAPALILVAGETGLGKSAFLRELGARAAAEGWSVAGSDRDGELTITPGTTPAAFERRLRGMLGLSGSVGAEATRPAEDGVRSAAEAAGDDAAEEKTRGLFAKFLQGARRWLSDASWLGLAELVRDLDGRAPILILIDGYCASEPFGRMFAGSFLPALTRSTEPLVVVVAEREDLLRGLTVLPSTVIPFGNVDERVIRAHLVQLAQGVAPAVSETELDSYADAAARRPGSSAA